ncbi:MAG: anaerobic ribonucleoside-triphosphate reductase [archaeon YNP-WB-062]|jgi:hypothetical protein|nr:anaerobic ribonucleoside-triphosphate reductase [Candidatus Culexarchaeum yellowstonense]
MKKKVVPCEVYSRVVGYFRPVSQWNKGKQQEFKERKWVKVSNSAFMENNKAVVGGMR